MNPDFYRAFEDKYRGPREMIKTRLRVYSPFVQQLTSQNTDSKAIDLGCGRGEWLELLGELGVDAHGVDLDDGMLLACRELGLSVETGEAISCLKNLPDESQVIVSGFHIVEHIPFDNLKLLVQEALRVLQPAGLLILETPNPENIVVGTSSFYLDPTHLNPIPPPLLAFLPEFYGFYRTKIIRLQESPDLIPRKAVSLLGVLSGASPDYAIIAQKRALPEVLAEFNNLFEIEYGVTLETLATRYDAQAENLSLSVSEAINLLSAKVGEVLGEIRTEEEDLLTELNNMRTEKEDLRTELSNAYAALNVTTDALERVSNSKSYRITSPLRDLSAFFRRCKKGIRTFSVSTTDLLLRNLAVKMRSTQLGRKLFNIVNRLFPEVRQKLTYRLYASSHGSLSEKNIQFTEFALDSKAEDKEYYLKLFQSEIEQRRQKKKQLGKSQ